METINKPSVEELLKPRYKVIADYPNQWHRTVAIITDLFYDDEYKDENWFAQYPAIFEKMQWWEERDTAEMPRYLKGEKVVYLISEYDFKTNTIYVTDQRYPLTLLGFLKSSLPATESEYLAYISSTTPTQGAK